MKMINSHVKFYRKQRELSQAMLAEMVGVSRNTISSIERGECIPSAETALKLCKALDVPFFELFNCCKNIDNVEFEEKSIDLKKKEDMIATLNSTLDAWINLEMKSMAKSYKKMKFSKAKAYSVELSRFLVNFYAFMQSHGIDAFMDYLERKDIFKVEENG